MVLKSYESTLWCGSEHPVFQIQLMGRFDTAGTLAVQATVRATLGHHEGARELPEGHLNASRSVALDSPLMLTRMLTLTCNPFALKTDLSISQSMLPLSGTNLMRCTCKLGTVL